MADIFNNMTDSMNKSSKGTILRSSAIFTVMELSGSFLTGKTGSGTTKSNFVTFCKSQYMDAKYHDISDLLYSIFRNGVLHSYVPKGAALLTSDPKAAEHHLKFCIEGLCIYVPEFSEDVTKAVNELKKEIKSIPELEEKYKSVLSALDSNGKAIYEEYVKVKSITKEDITFVGDINTNLG